MKKKLATGIFLLAILFILGITVDYFTYSVMEEKKEDATILEKEEKKENKKTLVTNEKKEEKETKEESQENQDLVLAEPLSSTTSVEKETPSVNEPEKEVTQEPAKEQKEILPEGNLVSFQRVHQGIQVDDLDERLKGYAYEIINLILYSEEAEVTLPFEWTLEEYEKVMDALNNTYCPYYGLFYSSYSNLGVQTYRIQITNSRNAYRINQEIESWIRSTANTIVSRGMTEKSAILAIHQFVCNSLTYNLQYGDLYDAITKGQGRCSSYALMMQAICNYVGIECNYVEGYAKGGFSGWGHHAWNQVKIGSNWYYVDSCWNDEVGNQYLLSSSLWEDHSL